MDEWIYEYTQVLLSYPHSWGSRESKLQECNRTCFRQNRILGLSYANHGHPMEKSQHFLSQHLALRHYKNTNWEVVRFFHNQPWFPTLYLAFRFFWFWTFQEYISIYSTLLYRILDYQLKLCRESLVDCLWFFCIASSIVRCLVQYNQESNPWAQSLHLVVHLLYPHWLERKWIHLSEPLCQGPLKSLWWVALRYNQLFWELDSLRPLAIIDSHLPSLLLYLKPRCCFYRSLDNLEFKQVPLLTLVQDWKSLHLSLLFVYLYLTRTLQLLSPVSG